MTAATGWAAGDYLDRPLRELLDDVAGADPVPAAGSVLALSGALAAALTAKVARRSAAHRVDAEKLAERADELRAILTPLITADAAAYAGVLDAHDAAATVAAMTAASEPPAAVARTGPAVTDLAAGLAATGNPNLRHDAQVAARLATVVAESAAALVAANSVPATLMEEQ